jgi:hypothetical protein
MIYMMYNIIIAALPLLLLGIAGVGTTNQVLAWTGDDWDRLQINTGGLKR